MNGYRCNCGRCRSRGLFAPVLLITLGVLFLLNQFYFVSFGRTWPVLLIVMGLVKVYQSTTSTEGHNPYGVAAAPLPPAQTLPPSDPSGQVHNG